MKTIIVRLTGALEDGVEVAAATSLRIPIPDGLDFHQTVNYITGHAAAEISRYMANECLMQLGHRIKNAG